MDTISESWFQSWKSKRNGELSVQQILRLDGLTKTWRPQTGEDIPPKLDDWISEPISEFWGYKVFHGDTELVEYCLSDIDDTEDASEMNPIRRRVLLLILHDIIRDETQQLREQAATQSRGRKRGKFLTQAVSNIVDRTYQSRSLSGNAIDRKRQRCTQLQRYGGKWSLFIRREAIIDFPLTFAVNRSVTFEILQTQPLTQQCL